jgi:predicted ATPase/DNA-binding SARP family transcriptional activator
MLRIWLLGELRINTGEYDVTPEALRQAWAGAVLACLALSRRFRSRREQLCEALWPEDDPDAALNRLNKALHAARRALEPGLSPYTPSRYLFTSGPWIELRSPDGIWLDVHAFEDAADTALATADPALLEAALSWYSGDLLADMEGNWLLADRLRLRERYGLLLRTLACIYEERGEIALAITTLRRLIAHDTADEDAHVTLIRLYARTGSRHLALRQYQQLREILRRELGTDPLPTSHALYTAIAAGQVHEPQSLPPIAHQLSPRAERSGTPRTNLPQTLPPVIGRDEDIVAVSQALETARLVTLIGPGGIGKTRLASAVGIHVLPRFSSGVWLVDLSGLEDPALLPHVILTTLEFAELTGRPPEVALAQTLAAHDMVLILDTCEHLREACSRLVTHLLTVCPRLRILATSREPLQARGEYVYAVRPLPFPDPTQPLTPEAVAAFPAVQLLLARARAEQPSLIIDEQTAEALATICAHLEGMPLALELAAARLNVLSVQQVASRLDNLLRLLQSTTETRSPRHQALQATLEWSYRLLSPAQQELFATLSVFAGSSTLDAIATVSALDPAEALDLLDALARKSLLVVEWQDDIAHYRLLDPVRHYAAAVLARSPQAEEVSARHATQYLDLAAQSQLRGPEQPRWIAQLTHALPNLRRAAQWLLEHGDPDQLAAFAWGLWSFWSSQATSEGRRWIAACLQRPDLQSGTLPAAILRFVAGRLAFIQGDYGEAAAALADALRCFRTLQEREHLADTLFQLGLVSFARGDYSTAQASYQEALALRRELRNPRDIALCLHTLGDVALATRDLLGAAAYYRDALTHFRTASTDPGEPARVLAKQGFLCYLEGACGAARVFADAALTQARLADSSRAVVLALLLLARLDIHDSDLQAARHALSEALTLCQAQRFRRELALGLGVLTVFFAAAGRPQDAWRAAAATDAVRQEIGSPPLWFEQDEVQRALAQAPLPEAERDALWLVGHSLPLEHLLSDLRTALAG